MRTAVLVLLVSGGTAVRAANELPEHVSQWPWAPEWLTSPNLSLQPGSYESNVEQTIDGTWKKFHNDLGFDPFVSYWGDFLANPSGGKFQSSAWFQLLQFGGEVYFEKYGLKGTSVFISAADATGQNLSNKIGNTFTVAQAVVGMNTIGLNNLYLKQKFGDNDFVEFRLGRMAAGSNFATLPIQGLAVSGATNGNPTSLFTNTYFKTSSSTSWAGFARIRPTEDTYAQYGIYQADPRAGLSAYNGLDFSIRPGDGVANFLETGWTPTFGATKDTTSKDTTSKDGKSVTTVTPGLPGLPGVYELGGYYTNYSMPTFTGGNEHNTFGFYLQAQQMIWRDRANPDLNLTLWGGITYSPQIQVALLPVMGYGGVELQGFMPGRSQDAVYMNYYIGGFSSDYSTTSIQNGSGKATAETVLEWSYVVQLTKNLQFQPDLQYVMRPGGTGSIPNALVVGFQVGALF